MAVKQGYDSTYLLPVNYKQRAAIFQRMEQMDSALHYQTLQYEGRLAWLKQANQEKVIEIEARYQNDKKARQLDKQAKEIAFERTQRNGLLVLIAFAVLFLALLAYLYVRLRKANRHTKDQAETIRQTNAELTRSLEQQIMLQGEIHHRVKNNLQVIIGLLDLQQEEIRDPQALNSLSAMANRIYSIAAIHDTLYRQSSTAEIPVREYVQTLCRHFQQMAEPDQPMRFALDIAPQLTFNLETLMPVGLMLNELLTNSLKYGRKAGKPLAVRVGLESDATGIHLHYRDNGPGFRHDHLEERRGGLGIYLLKSMVRQLQGHLHTYNDRGAVIEIFFQEKNREQPYASGSYSYRGG